MIALLRGRVWPPSGEEGETIVVDVGGVGYQVFPSTATLASLAALPPTGAEVQVYIHSHFVQDEPLRLYGFSDPGERRLFQTLIGVQGVGPRVALAILAGLSAEDLIRAIAAGDVGRLTQVKGVGRKTAERLALELREKILALPISKGAALAAAPPETGAPKGPLGEVYGALIQLGYKPPEIEPVIAEMDSARPVPDLIREALGALRRK